MKLLNDLTLEIERKTFTNRLKELENFEKLLKIFARRIASPLIIFGKHGVGKTCLMKRMIMVVAKSDIFLPVYINMKNIPIPPKLFVMKFIGDIVSFINDDVQMYRSQRYDLNGLINLLHSQNVRSGAKHLIDLKNELEKEKKIAKNIYTYALDFPRVISSDIHKKLVIFIDDFTEINDIGRYRGVKELVDNFIGHLRGHRRVVYVMSTSDFSIEKKISSDAHVLRIENFERETAHKLIRKIIPRCSVEIMDEIISYTKGHPLYTRMISTSLKVMSKGRYKKIDKRMVRMAYEKEAEEPHGRIKLYIQSHVNRYIYSARGSPTLLSVLRVLKSMGPMTLTQISYTVGRPTGEMNVYVKRLEKIGLIRKDGKMYCCEDFIITKP